MKKPFIVGITGGSASGKTLFLNQLLSRFDEKDICLVSQDNYYYPREQQPIDSKGIRNFDMPESIDFKAFARDIQTLKEGKTVIKEEYTFNNPNVTPRMLEFKPAPIIVVEGIFVFYYPEVFNLLDLRVFIEAKEYIKLKRRIIRDNEERGYDLDDVLYRYENHVAPTYERFIKPFKEDADIVIPNNVGFERGLEVLAAFMKNKIVESGSLV